MTTLHITRGLPGSGKTSFARKLAAETGAVRINRDDIRMMMFGEKGAPVYERELLVTETQRSAARAHLKAGRDVILDDTNLRPIRVRELRKLALECGADFQIHPFEVDAHTVIERQAGRPEADQVPADVILTMSQKYTSKGRLLPVPPEQTPSMPLRPYVPNTDLPVAMIIDIDGTVALKGDRDIYDASKCHLDSLNVPVVAMISGFAYGLAEITAEMGFPEISREVKWLFVSGRSEDYRAETEQWLTDHGLPIDGLFMRASGDKRRDAIIKAELFDQHIRDNYHVCWVFDDRNQVVEMWRSLGLTVFQVADGNF